MSKAFFQLFEMFNFLQQNKGAGNAYASKSTARGKKQTFICHVCGFSQMSRFLLAFAPDGNICIFYLHLHQVGRRQLPQASRCYQHYWEPPNQPAMRGKHQALSFLISFKELICICIFLFAFADAISTIGIHPTSNEEKALFNVSFVSKNLSFKLLFSSKSLWVFFCQNFAYNARSVI